MGVRLLLTGTVIGVLIGCGGPKRDVPIMLSNDKWTTGDTLWLRVVSADSVFSADSIGEGRRKEKYVRLVVLDTGMSARIEWQEFGVMTVEEDTTIPPGPGYFFPSTRMVYACQSDGSIDRLLNYPEMHARLDTMLNIYLDQAKTLLPDMREKLLAWGLDSARVTEHVLTDPELFHRSFGFTLTDSTKVEGALDLLDPALSPIRVRIERTHNALCDPITHVALHGHVEVDTVDFDQFMAGIDLLAPFLDTMGPVREAVDVTFDVCFDTTSGMPAYVEQVMSSRFWGHRIKKTTVIYRDERIAN